MRTPITMGVAMVLFALPSAFSSAASLDDPTRPLISLASSEAPPVIDGHVDADEWAPASSPAAFSDITDGSAAAVQPRVWVTRDDEAMYVAARLDFPRGLRPVANVMERDGPLWEDDALEVFIAPHSDPTDYYQFIVNSLGVQWDSRGRDPSWNTIWEVATHVADDHWTVEMRVPFVALGLGPPAEGEMWGFNVAWDRQTPERMIASWAPVGTTLHAPERFGQLVFAADAPAVQAVGPQRPEPDRLLFSGTWHTPNPAQARLTVTRQEDDRAREVAVGSAAYAGGEPAPLTVEAQLPREDDLPAPGDYRLRFEVSQAGRVTHRSLASLIILPPLQMAMRSYLLSGYVEVDADVSGMGRPRRDVSVSAAIMDADNRETVMRPQRITLTEDLAGTTRFDVGELPPGDYHAATAVNDRRGRLLQQATIAFTLPETPEWRGSTEGISDEVLAPWTPVELDGSLVGVWGRNYRFGPLPLPSHVTTAGEDVLAGPIILRMVADGKEQSWRQDGPVETLDEQPNVARLAVTAAGEDVRCEGQVTVEYDGMIRCDFTLTPRGAREVEELSLVIPLKADHAKYLYHFPGRWGSAYNAGALPEEGFTAGFRPFIWLGDEERGFSWFSESDRNFFLDDENLVTEITREGDMVMLHVHMIRGGHRMTEPLEYTFGFQATPVKPMRPDVWDYRICHMGNYGIEEREWRAPAHITYPAEGNIVLEQGTFEAWVRPRFDPQPDIAPDAPDRGRYNRSLFDVVFPDGDRIGFYWNIDDRGMRVYYKEGDTYPLLIGARAPWQQGEWYHVALTWGDRTRIYLDGELVGERVHEGTLPKRLEGAKITLARGYGEPCEFDIDEVRISSIARDSFDLERAPEADEHTLLLERFDEPLPAAGDRRTAPEVGTPGIVEGGAIIEGKFGGAFSQDPDDEPMTILDRLAQLGVRTICFHEHWTDIQNYTSTTHGDKLHSLVEACHEHGIQLLPYFGYEISNIAPEWDLYAEECLVYPRRGGYQRQPEQRAYIVCYRSEWQDFMAHGIAQVMDEYGVDGVYLDGTANPWGCRNVHHGCGYEKPDGSIGVTYPIFATREMMRRIYTIVKSRNPEGQVNVHQSTCMTIPTLAWATSYWDGEQFGGIERGPDPLTVLPLDAFRTEFMGHQWGVPAEFLCYERPYTFSQAMSFTLLHDVLVRGRLGGSLEMVSRLWHGMEEFGRDGAVWLPYWDNASYVRLGPDDSIKASIYSQAEEGCVVVVSNLGSENKVAEVTLDYEGLALAAGMEAVDMITGLEVPITDHLEMSFPLKPFDFRVIWVRHK